MERRFRHELKYICSRAELEIIKSRIKHIAKSDSHVSEDGNYLIRSIYFDDYYNSSFYNNESGVDSREKWRIRSYNCDKTRINLECKMKEHGMIHKEVCELSFEQYLRITANDRLDINGDNAPLLNKFLTLRETKLLRPVVIVQYRRFPYICKEGNVRITFDCDIATSTDICNFFDSGMSTRPVMPNGMQLLEVKYDEFLPDCIYQTVQLKNMEQTTFSKYFLCRKFSTRTGGTFR
ncbi:MAG: polyphosphate polymerase domain-containing protein [Lachnospiraceae bacterium]|nr:polyphosphate polymerase domain-containing protein [Lachnospiraceae bacterium]